MRKTLTALLLCVMLLALVACGNSAQEETVYSLKDLSPIEYAHAAGFSLSIPGEWEETATDDFSVSFSDADGTISAVARMEIGGMSYFSNSELGDLAAEIGLDILNNATVVESGAYGRLAAGGYACVSGQTADGINAVCSAVVLQHIPAVRCYVVITADPEIYQQYSGAIDDIFASLKVTKAEDDLYAQLDELHEEYTEEKEQREAEASVSEE